MEGLTKEQAIKALEEGKTLQFFDDGEWLDSSCKGDALRVEFNMNNGFIYRIKPTEEGKEVVMYGGCDIDDGLFKFNQWQYD